MSFDSESVESDNEVRDQSPDISVSELEPHKSEKKAMGGKKGKSQDSQAANKANTKADKKADKKAD